LATFSPEPSAPALAKPLARPSARDEAAAPLGFGSYRLRHQTDQPGASHARVRLLVTSSRTWDDTAVMEHALAVILARHPEVVLLMHGACPLGSDGIASAHAARGVEQQSGPTVSWLRVAVWCGALGSVLVCVA
jgi:hypothetical protein